MAKFKLDNKGAEDALRLVSNGISNVDICAYLGVAESTFYAWISEPKTDAQRKLSDGIKKAEIERKAWYLQKILNAAAEGSWQAAAWYLERRYPKEFAKAKRPEEDPNAELINKMDELINQIERRNA